MYLEYYLKQLDYENKPQFLDKYLKSPSLLRLKKVGYFCGMDYASKSVYNFREYISRYDHSLTVALLTYKLTKDKVQTLSALFHDIATPCFSHVIDYMNKDYTNQESTEEYTERIIKEDVYLLECLKEDNIDIEDIIDFKKYPVVDNKRPKVCTDRIDGVILTGACWTKNITLDDIYNIVNDMCLVINEDDEQEIGFTNKDTVDKIINISKSIDVYCHSNEDNYMMNLLADITKKAIDNKYIKYDDLYELTEEEILEIFNSKNDLDELMNLFYNIKLNDIPNIELPDVKIRDLNPLLNGKRVK